MAPQSADRSLARGFTSERGSPLPSWHFVASPIEGRRMICFPEGKFAFTRNLESAFLIRSVVISNVKKVDIMFHLLFLLNHTWIEGLTSDNSTWKSRDSSEFHGADNLSPISLSLSLTFPPSTLRSLRIFSLIRGGGPSDRDDAA